MSTTLFSQYANTIRIKNFNGLNDDLLMERDGKLSIYYAPFDYTNTQAKVVIVGITPGKTQMVNALNEAHRQLNRGASMEDALRAAKRTASFSGAMRPNLIGLLDRIGLHRRLGIATCAALFESANHLVQTTSVLRFPVFVDGENYSGNPNMLKQPLLRRYLLEHFGQEARTLSDALFVPLGDKVAQALEFLACEGVIDSRRVLGGLPHPSGANAERIAYFLGQKAKEKLSIKTDPEKLDQALTALRYKVSA